MNRIQLIAASTAAIFLTTAVAGCKTQVPATIGYCTIIHGDMVVTGGRTIAAATMVCARKPEDFAIGAQVQFQHGRNWAMYTHAVSTQAPPAGDVLGKAYVIRTGCLKKTRVRLLLTIRATFGIHRNTWEGYFPSKSGIRTGNCDEL